MEKFKRALQVENGRAKYSALPASLEFELEELPRWYLRLHNWLQNQPGDLTFKNHCPVYEALGFKHSHS
jgi:hypothetical protein